jgi:hypothetical protein
MRIIIAAILGGIAMFAWTSVAHIATPLGSMGLQQIPDDAPIVASLQGALGANRGIYFFPSGGMATDDASQKAYAEKLKTSAEGLVIYNPPGAGGLQPRQLIIEACLEIGESLLLAIVLAAAARGFGARLGLAAVVGAVAAVSTNASYWNWYGFGDLYTAATMFTEVVKYLVAGLVAAVVLGRGKAKAS